MTKEECRADLANGWNTAPNGSGRKAMLINAGWNAFGQADQTPEDFVRNGSRIDTSKTAEYSKLSFEQLPVDMQERMVTAYYNENKE